MYKLLYIYNTHNVFHNDNVKSFNQSFKLAFNLTKKKKRKESVHFKGSILDSIGIFILQNNDKTLAYIELVNK